MTPFSSYGDAYERLRCALVASPHEGRIFLSVFILHALALSLSLPPSLLLTRAWNPRLDAEDSEVRRPSLARRRDVKSRDLGFCYSTFARPGKFSVRLIPSVLYRADCVTEVFSPLEGGGYASFVAVQRTFGSCLRCLRSVTPREKSSRKVSSDIVEGGHYLWRFSDLNVSL